MRTPEQTGNFTFQGDKLVIDDNGGVNCKTLGNITINNLVLRGAYQHNRENNKTLFGNIEIPADSTKAVITIAGVGYGFTIAANLTGSGPLELRPTIGSYPINLRGDNTGFTGRLQMNGTETRKITILTEDNLGGPPPVFAANHITVNNTSLVFDGNPSTTVTNRNRGITLQTHGWFEVPAGRFATLDSPVAGTGAFTKSGAGTLVLGGDNPFTGAGTVRNGTLVLNGTNAAPMTVNAGASFGGTGRVNNTLTFAAGSAFEGMAAGGNLPPLHITGAVTLGGTVTVNVALPPGKIPAGDYTLMTYASLGGAGAFSLAGSHPDATLIPGLNALVYRVAYTNPDGTGLPFTLNHGAFPVGSADAELHGEIFQSTTPFVYPAAITSYWAVAAGFAGVWDDCAEAVSSDPALFAATADGLAPGTEYVFKHQAAYDAGGSTTYIWSEPDYFTTKDDAPVVHALSATDAGRHAATARGWLEWVGAGESAAEIWLWYGLASEGSDPTQWSGGGRIIDGATAPSPASAPFTWQITGLDSGTEYQYAFLASNSLQGAWSAPVFFDTASQTFVWSGAGGDFKWETVANWNDGAGQPARDYPNVVGDIATINAAAVLSISLNTPVALGKLTLAGTAVIEVNAGASGQMTFETADGSPAALTTSYRSNVIRAPVILNTGLTVASVVVNSTDRGRQDSIEGPITGANTDITITQGVFRWIVPAGKEYEYSGTITDATAGGTAGSGVFMKGGPGKLTYKNAANSSKLGFNSGWSFVEGCLENGVTVFDGGSFVNSRTGNSWLFGSYHTEGSVRVYDGNNCTAVFTNGHLFTTRGLLLFGHIDSGVIYHHGNTAIVTGDTTAWNMGNFALYLRSHNNTLRVENGGAVTNLAAVVFDYSAGNKIAVADGGYVNAASVTMGNNSCTVEVGGGGAQSSPTSRPAAFTLRNGAFAVGNGAALFGNMVSVGEGGLIDGISTLTVGNAGVASVNNRVRLCDGGEIKCATLTVEAGNGIEVDFANGNTATGLLLPVNADFKNGAFVRPLANVGHPVARYEIVRAATSLAGAETLVIADDTPDTKGIWRIRPKDNSVWLSHSYPATTLIIR